MLVALFALSGGLAAGLFLLASGQRVGDWAAVRGSLRSARETVPVVGVTAQVDKDDRSFMERVVLPVMGRTGRSASRLTPAGYAARARRRLVLAGRPQSDDFDRFVATRVVSLALIPVVFVLVALLPVGRAESLLFFFVPALLLALGPEVGLDRKVRARQEQIRRQLADVSDLLMISVEAGLGFEQALGRTVASMPGPLTEEFTRMLGETKVGAGRKEALERVGDRTDVEELRSFLRALIQADSYGISIVQILRAQSHELRVARRQDAQERAQKAPVKMLFPLVFCIMPALFVVVAGPAAIQIYHTIIK